MLKRSGLAFVVFLATVGLALLAGCLRGTAERPVPPSAADTLANGLPRTLVPKLESWLQVWRHVNPSFAAESLEHGAPLPFEFRFSWAGSAGGIEGGVRARALVDVVSPDSTHSLDFDMYLEFARDEGGRIYLSREVDSAPILADFRSDTLWQVDFCGTPCFYDGAYWVDAGRFALSGATESGSYEAGTWRGFLDVYDLRTRLASRWVTCLVDSAQLARYQSASDSVLVARLERAGLGAGVESATGSRLRFARP